LARWFRKVFDSEVRLEFGLGLLLLLRRRKKEGRMKCEVKGDVPAFYQAWSGGASELGAWSLKLDTY